LGPENCQSHPANLRQNQPCCVLHAYGPREERWPRPENRADYRRIVSYLRLGHDLELVLTFVSVELMFVIGTLVPTFYLDRMGRRKTAMTGVFGLGVCMMMISILLSFHKRNTSIAATAFFFLYMLIFGGSM
jgi:Sugar (and other) transporter